MVYSRERAVKQRINDDSEQGVGKEKLNAKCQAILVRSDK
jgi:hypothetical protein